MRVASHRSKRALLPCLERHHPSRQLVSVDQETVIAASQDAGRSAEGAVGNDHCSLAVVGLQSGHDLADSRGFDHIAIV